MALLSITNAENKQKKWSQFLHRSQCWQCLPMLLSLFWKVLNTVLTCVLFCLLSRRTFPPAPPEATRCLWPCHSGPANLWASCTPVLWELGLGGGWVPLGVTWLGLLVSGGQATCQACYQTPEHPQKALWRHLASSEHYHFFLMLKGMHLGGASTLSDQRGVLQQLHGKKAWFSCSF